MASKEWVTKQQGHDVGNWSLTSGELCEHPMYVLGLYGLAADSGGQEFTCTSVLPYVSRVGSLTNAKSWMSDLLALKLQPSGKWEGHTSLSYLCQKAPV